MALITPTPLYYKDAILTIAGDDYAPAASTATLSPNISATTYYGLKPTAVFPETSVDWTLELSFVQDWDSATSLSRYLYANQGSEVAVILQPKDASGPSFTMTVHVVPGTVGGDTRAFAASSVSLPLVGAPTLVEP